MEHILYKTTNSINGRFYIGIHSSDNLNDGYLGSGKRIRTEITKYGKENFVREILEFCSTRAELKQKESEIVNEELLKHPLCLNLKNGGEGNSSADAKRHWQSAEYKEKIKRARKETWQQEGYREKMQIALKLALAKPETKAKMIEHGKNQKGKRKHSEETKEHLSKRFRSPEERAKVSAGMRAYHQKRKEQLVDGQH